MLADFMKRELVNLYHFIFALQMFVESREEELKSYFLSLADVFLFDFFYFLKPNKEFYLLHHIILVQI